MRLHTPPPAVDVTQVVDGIGAYAKSATRLHPRRAQVTAQMSHVGGPLLWPADEPWPYCDRDLMAETTIQVPPDWAARKKAAEARRTVWNQVTDEEIELDKELSRLLDAAAPGTTVPETGHWAGRSKPMPHPAPNALIAVAQLRAADIPDLWCPPDCDLLQVLWCPCDHVGDGQGPAIELRWRRESEGMVAMTAPATRVDHNGYVATPCRLNLEQIVEYPDLDDLPEAMSTIVCEVLDDDQTNEYARDYCYSLSVAPGWKIGGWPKWNLSGKDPRGCATCDQPMTLLLTIDSSEYDGGTGPRWQPTEDRHISWRDPERRAIHEPTDVVVGRHGSLRIFICTHCPETPHRWDYQ